MTLEELISLKRKAMANFLVETLTLTPSFQEPLGRKIRMRLQ
jgi:hypothetical protein